MNWTDRHGGQLLIAATVALTGGFFTCWSAKTATDPQFVSMAVDVLRSPPSDSSRAIREWSVDLLNKHSRVKLDSAQRQELLGGALPRSSRVITSKTDPFLAVHVPEELWLTVGLGSVCTDPTVFTLGDTAVFALQTHDLPEIKNVAGVVIWVFKHPESKTVIYQDVVRFAQGQIRARVPTAELGRGSYLAEMWFGFDDPLNPELKAFARGVCEFSVE